jgi:hypothetical protein
MPPQGSLTQKDQDEPKVTSSEALHAGNIHS